MKNHFSRIIVYAKDNLQFILGIKKFYYKNYEKITDYYLTKHFYKNRKHGLSAIMRIKNDEKWIFYAVTSIIDFVDEIIVVLQNCTDKTEEIIRSINSSKIKIFYYPFESFPISKYHKNYLKNSVFNKAYYYNYALTKSSYTYVWKWDGDHAAFEHRVAELRKIIDKNEFDIIHYFGIDMFGSELKYTCRNPFVSNEPSVFKVNRRTFYYSGDIYEWFSYPLNIRFRKMKIFNYPHPLFLHFKYANNTPVLIKKGWINNWQDEKHLSELVESKSKGEMFKDEYPEVIKKYYFKMKNEN